MEAKGVKANQIVLINKNEGQRVCPIVIAKPANGALPQTKNYIVTPGVNSPRSRAEFEQACENKTFAKWVAYGDVYELTGDITEWTDDHATAMMKRTSDIEGLRWWFRQCKKGKFKDQLELMIESFEKMYRDVKKKKVG